MNSGGVSRKTVVVADDHAFSAKGLAEALEETGSFEVLATAENGIEAIAVIKKFAPDCAVLDLDMPGANGLEVLLECRRWVPQTRVAILTGTNSSATFLQLLDAGVHGILTKAADPQEICESILKIACGQDVYNDDVTQILDEAKQAVKLTARELEVLIGLSKGLSNVGIAARLNVSPKTVDSHRTNLMRKLDVNSTASLLVKAMRGGLF